MVDYRFLEFMAPMRESRIIDLDNEEVRSALSCGVMVLCPVQALCVLTSSGAPEGGWTGDGRNQPLDFFYRSLMASYEIDHHRI